MFESFVLSLLLGVCSVAVNLLLALPLAIAWHGKKEGVSLFLETLLGLPQVLPPTVLGFLLLLTFSPVLPLGRWLDESLGLQLVFSFPLLVIGTAIMSFPGIYNTLKRGLVMIPRSLEDGAALLGMKRWRYVSRVVLPLLKGHLISAGALGFGQSLGAFGVVLMVGGNIAGRTKTISIYLFELVEQLRWTEAAWATGVLLVVSYGVLLVAKHWEARVSHVVL